MQSKENTACQISTDASESGSPKNKTENIIQSEPKKVPPKPPKRVSFLTSNKERQNTINIVNKEENKNEKELTILGDNTKSNELDDVFQDQTLANSAKLNDLSHETDKCVIYSDKKCDNNTPKTNNCSTPCKENGDKVVNKEKINITNNTTLLSIIKKETITAQERTVTRNNSLKQLKSDFVKSNDSTNIQTSFSWKNHKQVSSSSVKEQTSVSSDPQSRLSESQSKIAKLQLSLPTKLSDATVQSLKNKYSPSNFGYPKNFQNSNGFSKIPSLVTRSSSVSKAKIDSEINGNKERQEISLNKKKVVEKNNNLPLNTEKDSEELIQTSNKEELKVKKKTFKTELYITPEIEIESPSIVAEVDNNKNEIKELINNKKAVEDTSVSVVVDSLHYSANLPKTECGETVIIEEEEDSDTVTLSDESVNSQKKVKSNQIDSDTDRKYSETSSSNLTLTDGLSEEENMEDGSNKKSTKKRSNSFRRIFGFGKDKKKNEEPKYSKNGIKKNDVQSDNIENEINVFDRNAPQRHTFSGHGSAKSNHSQENIKPGSYGYRSADDKYQNKNTAIYSNQGSIDNNRLNSSVPVSMRYQYSTTNQETKIHERERLNMNTIQYDLYLAQQTNKRLNSSLNMPVNSSRADEYVCMDNLEKQNRNDLTQPGFINSHAVSKYIDTTSSSSTCTLESDNQNNVYENALSRQLSPENQSDSYNSSGTRIPLPRTSSEKKIITSNGEKFYERPKFSNSPEIFTTTPRRILDPQLIKPKAIIPINTERSLPNPYRNNKEEPGSCAIVDNIYGNITKSQTDNNINEFPGRTTAKEHVYGKPVPAVRKNINVDTTYGNLPRSNRETCTEDELYGTVYDSLSPVGAQLRITKTNVIRSQNKSVDKNRARSISPAQRPRNINSCLSPTNLINKFNMEPPMSPNRKEIEGTKLKLSPNREKLDPRLKSPIDDKLKETLSPNLKKKEIKKKNDGKDNFLSHQNLEIEIDYPDNNINEEQAKKDTPDKAVFPMEEVNKQESEPSSPRRMIKLQRSPHVSPSRPKSLQNLAKIPQNVSQNVSQNIPDNVDNRRITYVRSPVTVRMESPASIASSSVQSSPRSAKLPASNEDLRDLKSTEVYFWEQTNKLSNKSNESDVSPDQSPQHVLTEVVVHRQLPLSPRKSETPSKSTPNLNKQDAPPSPQKQQNLKNLEAFYWHEIKKLKEKEEHEIYNQQIQILGRNNSMNLPPTTAQQHRSRSMSPAVNRQRDKRSLSLPRDMQPQRINSDAYGYARKREVIVEERPQPPQQTSQYGVVRHNIQQNQNFIRASPQRSTIGPINTQKQHNEMIYENYFPGVELRHQARSGGYAPIFKRGSLTNSTRESSPQNNKKVSFSSAKGEESQAWPTKNGFTQSPPTRRVEKRLENIEDDVFYPNVYQNMSPVVENERNLQQQKVSPNKMIQSESPYGPTQHNKVILQQVQYSNKNDPTYDLQRMRIQDQRFTNTEQAYSSNSQNYHNAHVKEQQTQLRKVRSASVEPLYISSKPPQYPNTQEPIYVTKSKEQIYGRNQPKQVSITNKVCDIYGQIHEQPNIYGNIQKSGVIYGQLQQNPVPGSPMSLRNQCLNKSDPSFVRGGRLTASFNDMKHEAPRRPLPPVPREKMVQHGRVVPVVSESESGSEAGEVQRILERREMHRRQVEYIENMHQHNRTNYV